MSAVVDTYRDGIEATYAVDFSRDREPMKARKRFPEYRRTGGAPTRVNGMHCRRNKRWTWGSGRSARVLNLRAFAGAVAFAMASCAASVFGVTLDMAVIGNPGNAPYIVNGVGGVPYAFEISKYETTNDQYVEFLNKVGQSNPNGIYSTLMGSDTNGGIVQAGSSGSFTYSVKTGVNPMGVPYGQLPVNFVNWFSAARFVNWLHNGQTTNVASLETGSYALANATGGPIPARQPGATYVLPSLNEWAKGAFNTGGPGNLDYTQWGTNSNTKPTIDVTAPFPANTANYGGGVAGANGSFAVGTYGNSLSWYGLYETMGNVAEMTDTPNPANANQWTAMGGSFGTSSGGFNGFNLPSTPTTWVGGGSRTAQIGFRVAAVPEPGTIAMAATAAAGLAGCEWNRRRKAKATRVVA